VLRLPAVPFLVAGLLLSGFAPVDGPPPAPEGFTWKRVESVKASFLMPTGWHFKEEGKGDTRAFFISQEDIDKAGQFETGLTVNVLSLQRDPAQRRAMQAAADFAGTGQLLDSWDTEAGVLRGFGCRIRRVERGRPPLILHFLAIGNSRTNTLYLILFESPEANWGEAWKKGEVMLRDFLLDDEV
jgi:hypothetical protein